MHALPKPFDPPRRGVIARTLAALLLTVGLGLLWSQVGTPQSVTYAQFQTLLDTGQVSRVVVQGSRAIVNLHPPSQPASVSLRLPSAEFEAQLTARNRLSAQGP